ncbi:MAG: hypothetical protein Q9195_001190 [Heterodermia aff. obscurata]
MPSQARWTLENLPNILYTIKRPKEQSIWGTIHAGPPVKSDANGRPVLERWPISEDIAEIRPLRDIPILPDQMPEGGIRMRPDALEIKRLYSVTRRHRQEFYLLDWYMDARYNTVLNNQICYQLKPKQLQDNCSRGTAPGLIDPAKGEADGNRVSLPSSRLPKHYSRAFEKLRRRGKPFMPSPEPKTEPSSTESNLTRTESIESSEEGETVDLPEYEASPDPTKAGRRPEIRLPQARNRRIASKWRPLERRQELRRSGRLAFTPEKDDRERQTIDRPPSLMVLSNGCQIITSDQPQLPAASTRSTRSVEPRYSLRKRVTTDHKRRSNRSSQSSFDSNDESGVIRPQRPETGFVARKSKRSRIFFSDTDSEKVVPNTGAQSDGGDEIAETGPSAKQSRHGSIKPTEQICRDLSRERSLEVAVNSQGVDVIMEDMPLNPTSEPSGLSNATVEHTTTTAEPSSTSSIGVVHGIPGQETAIDETMPSTHTPSDGTPNRIGNVMEALIKEVIELKSRVASLKPRDSLTPEPLGEHIDRVAKIAIELRAGSGRLLDEVTSLRDTVDKYEGHP